MQLTPYSTAEQDRWDRFVAESRNGVFLFQRSYMEYHSDRFEDLSFLLCDGRSVRAVFPASVKDDTVTSHGGLTFGGFVSGADMKGERMLRAFDVLLDELRRRGVKRLVYKAVPHIYHTVPAEEDLYALFRNGAVLTRRDISATLLPGRRLPLSKGRRYSLKQALRRGLRVEQTTDFDGFMQIERERLLEKYGVLPVHTAAELSMLAERFPDNIKLFCAYDDDEMVAGVVVYESSNVAHAQYIGTTPEGQQHGGLDVIISFLLDEYYAEKAYFDFGISTEDDGRVLNEGLLKNKESYGARATVYDTYSIDL